MHNAVMCLEEGMAKRWREVKNFTQMDEKKFMILTGTASSEDKD